MNHYTIKSIEQIVSHKVDGYITEWQYDIVKSLIRNNTSDLFNVEVLPCPLINDILDNAEMYYGFNKNEADRLLKRVEAVGYTFNTVDVATRDNGGMDHTVKLYALRLLTDK